MTSLSSRSLKNAGVLLVNIGTPAEPTAASVRRYLKEFLSDRRVVKLPRLLWYPILYGIILPFRAKTSAALYQKIWLKQGSPLLINTQNIAKKLSASLNIPVVVAMRYGDPSFKTALATLQEKKIRRLIVLPLYPQYSATTTASIFDYLTETLKKWKKIPTLEFIADYATHPLYIKAICQHIRTCWEKSGKKYLIFSFHGIPKYYIDQGDPYYKQCLLSVQKITKKLTLDESEFCLSFQSRLGRSTWLQPYTDQTLAELPKKGITEVQIICPGFSVDCLETLEEIALRGREQFMQKGGKYFEYIPALNDDVTALALLESLIKA